MAKTIVFCADGTWNGPGQTEEGDTGASPTNVFKLYLSLAGKDAQDALTYLSANEQERTLRSATGDVLQVAKYLHGVGDSSNFLVKVLGGALGAGVITRIVRGYTFLSRNYEPGDRIYIVGFSRGAYTARALAGMVCNKGLLDPAKYNLDDKDTGYRLGSRVWADYRSAVCRRVDATWLQRLEGLLVDLPRFFSGGGDPQLIPDIGIEVVAVWDTVGAYGIPQYQLDGYRLDLFQFADLALSPKVKYGIHAVSVDERRADFTPTLWDSDPARIEQVLFPGAHADVGGSYPARNNECGLSDGSLVWMIGKLKDRGVLIADPLPLKLSPDPLGTAHQPWRHPPWTILSQADRQGLKKLPRHASVDQRWSKSVRPDPDDEPEPYLPPSLT